MGHSQIKRLSIVFLDLDDIHNPLLHGGQSISTFEVGKRLARLGHKVTVICSRYPGFKNRTENGIRYHHIGLGTGNIRINNLAYILSLPFIVPFIKADIIIECFTAPVSTLLSPLFTNVPVVGKPSSFEAQRFSKKYHLPFFLIEKYGCRIYKYFLSSSHAIETKMKSLNSNIVSRIVPEGVDENFFSVRREKPKHILFVGRFDIGQKGIDILIESYANISNKISYPLVIAGHGPNEQSIRSMIKKLHLENRISIVGATYGKEKLKLLSESVCIVLPSRHEGFSLFALEGMAAGVPLVTFDIPGLEWIGNNSRFIAKSFSVKDYAKNLLLATNLEIQQNIARQARNVAKLYSWDEITKEYELYFMDILKYEQLQTSTAKNFTQYFIKKHNA